MKVLLGVTGSVAAVLAPKLCKSINQETTVILTEKATQFVYNTDFSVYDKSPEFLNNNLQIPTAIYRDDCEWKTLYKKGDEILHIKLSQEADVLVIAPLSACTMAKIANGICDNLLTSIVRAWGSKKPLVIAPAMNTEMWNSQFTAMHMRQIAAVYNIRDVPPQSKMLACGVEGMGAMADISKIVATINDFFYK